LKPSYRTNTLPSSHFCIHLNQIQSPWWCSTESSKQIHYTVCYQNSNTIWEIPTMKAWRLRQSTYFTELVMMCHVRQGAFSKPCHVDSVSLLSEKGLCSDMKTEAITRADLRLKLWYKTHAKNCQPTRKDIPIQFTTLNKQNAHWIGYWQCTKLTT
jgi:hypothetical protein